MDFNMLLLLLTRMLRGTPDALAELRATYRQVMVDEVQVRHSFSYVALCAQILPLPA